MHFFDANCGPYGLSENNVPTIFPTVKEILADMDAAGVEKTTLWHISQKEMGWSLGNKLIVKDLNENPEAKKRISPSWCVVPTVTSEQGSAEQVVQEMLAANAGTVRIFPEDHRWELYPAAIGDLFTLFTENHIPVYLSVKAMGWDKIYRTMYMFPDLYVIICDCGLWGPDRRIRPLLVNYKHTYFETSEYWAAGSIADTVHAIGPDRLLYGSGAPHYGRGSMMLAIQHADISDEAKELIAHGNLERLLQH
ncbi:MAG: amidohydrolase family protein [Victivallales bacterium]|nr:amidohydrolase family protein [Victivallales bacterium]